MKWNELTGEVIGAAIEVHRELGGPGLLEGIYEAALVHELTLRSVKVEQQVTVPVKYKGESIKYPHVVDILVDGRLIIEVKATGQYNSIFEAQLLTYLRLTKLPLGLVINFGERTLKEGVRRVVNEFVET